MLQVILSKWTIHGVRRGQNYHYKLINIKYSIITNIVSPFLLQIWSYFNVNICYAMNYIAV